MARFVMNAWKDHVSAASLDGYWFIRIDDDFRATDEHVEQLRAAFARPEVPQFHRERLRKDGFQFDSLGPFVDLIHLAETGEYLQVFEAEVK